MDDRTSRPLSYGRAGAQGAEIDAGLRRYMLGVYNYMASGVLLTGIVSLLFYSTPALMQLLFQTNAAGQLVGVTPLYWIAALSPLAFVLVINFGINRLSPAAAQGLFWAFCAVMGVSLSSIFLRFTAVSITQIFFVTAVAFGSLSLWGYTTKKNLSGWGSFLLMGLVGIIVASIVNIFLGSSMLHFVISAAGVLVFAGLTAYDTQMIRREYDQLAGNSQLLAKGSILGALRLYLDFINLFLMLLNLFGNRE